MIIFTIINQSKQINFSSVDMEYLNKNEKGVRFEQIPCSTLIPQDICMILIEISENIGINALYDMLKYSFSNLLNLIQRKMVSKKEKMELVIKKNGKEFKCTLPFNLSEEQKDKFVDAIIENMKYW